MGPVRVFRLGAEPGDDLSGSTTAQQRLDILRELSERAWRLTGREFPSYARHEIPVRVIRGYSQGMTGGLEDSTDLEALGEDVE